MASEQGWVDRVWKRARGRDHVRFWKRMLMGVRRPCSALERGFVSMGYGKGFGGEVARSRFDYSVPVHVGFELRCVDCACYGTERVG